MYLVSLWAIYCILIWFLFLRPKSNRSTDGPHTADEADIKANDIGFVALWKAEPTLHALLEVIVSCPDVSDKLAAARALVQRFGISADGDKANGDTIKEFLKLRGDRVLSWVDRDEVVKSGSDSDARDFAELQAIMRTLDRTPVLSFFKGHFEDGVDIQRNAEREFPKSDERRVSDRWHFSDKTSRSATSPGFNCLFPEVEVIRHDCTGRCDAIENQSGIVIDLSMLPSQKSSYPYLLRWGGDPATPLKGWGASWVSRSIEMNDGRCSLSVNDGLTMITTQVKDLHVLLAQRFVTSSPEESKLLDLLSVLIAVPVSWSLSLHRTFQNDLWHQVITTRSVPSIGDVGVSVLDVLKDRDRAGSETVISS